MKIKLKKLIPLSLLVQIIICVFLIFPDPTKAVDSYQLQVPIGNLRQVNFEQQGTTKPIAQFIQSIYNYAIGTVAILATLVMMIGGVVWMTAGGDSGRVGEAKKYIQGALLGMVLVFCSYMILNTIDPDLVSFKPIGVQTVNQLIGGCCIENGAAKNSANTQCTGSFYPGETANGTSCEKTGPGCCYISEGVCVLSENRKSCSNIYFPGLTCNKIYGCPQKGSACDGTNETNYKTACTMTNGDTGVCLNNGCVTCEKTPGDGCLVDKCCAGMCCDKNTNTCKSGEIQDGNKYCK